MIVNLRGTNGSGKTTLARRYLSEKSEVVNLALWSAEINGKQRRKLVVGHLDEERDVILVGSYANECGGMDAIPDFETAREAIRTAACLAKVVIAEGILASTVYGSWARFAHEINTQTEIGPFCFVYLRTPIEECLARIQARNGGKPVKEDQIKKKVSAIDATRKRAINEGHFVYDLPVETPELLLETIIKNGGGDDGRIFTS